MQTDFWCTGFWGEAESELCCMVDVRADIACHNYVMVMLKIFELWLRFM